MPMLADYADLIAKGLVHVLEVDGAVAAYVVLVREPEALLWRDIAVSPISRSRLGPPSAGLRDAEARAAGYESHPPLYQRRQ